MWILEAQEHVTRRWLKRTLLGDQRVQWFEGPRLEEAPRFFGWPPSGGLLRDDSSGSAFVWSPPCLPERLSCGFKTLEGK